ncbi:type II and III secretion system protein family protein [Aquabacterium sp. A08]|uniref:type II and III secretion system protein family protein n=1 Tax=Aquabacterium sp. A08 TaxID=2718532 RepID=UPI00141F4407|nr:type II and III secretion system protein family protein [Aquabacterium sp. A08]NIC40981.1 type II and III secretion system protein family protein [Aquabacterium sp. A08]
MKPHRTPAPAPLAAHRLLQPALWLALLPGLGWAQSAEPVRTAPRKPVQKVTAPAASASQTTTVAATPSALALRIGQERSIALAQRPTRVSTSNDAAVDVQPLRGAKAGEDSLLLRAVGLGTSQVSVWLAGRNEPLVYTVHVTAEFTSLRLSGRPGSVELTGAAPQVLTHVQDFRAAQAVAGKAPLVDRSSVDLPSTVQVHVKVVEFSRSDLRAAGINFNASNQRGNFSFGLQSNAAPSNAPFSFFASTQRGNFAPSVSLRLLESQGLLRVLAEPTLVTMSGQMASFLAGGEIPIPVPSSEGTVAIEYKTFGIALNLTPTVLSRDRIVLKVAPEASDLDYQNALVANGFSIPAITTRRADTMVELGDGESFVIGGLVSRTTTSNVNQVPGLGKLPILGAFFKNVEYQSKESELALIVTPHLVQASKAGTDLPTLPGDQRERPSTVLSNYFLGPWVTNSSLPGFSR